MLLQKVRIATIELVNTCRFIILDRVQLLCSEKNKDQTQSDSRLLTTVGLCLLGSKLGDLRRQMLDFDMGHRGTLNFTFWVEGDPYAS